MVKTSEFKIGFTKYAFHISNPRASLRSGAFEESALWRRYAKDSNIKAHGESMDKIRLGLRPLASDNSFDMAAWFSQGCLHRLPVAAP